MIIRLIKKRRWRNKTNFRKTENKLLLNFVYVEAAQIMKWYLRFLYLLHVCV